MFNIAYIGLAKKFVRVFPHRTQTRTNFWANPMFHFAHLGNI